MLLASLCAGAVCLAVAGLLAAWVADDSAARRPDGNLTDLAALID